MNNNNNNNNVVSFFDTFNNISKNLSIRYTTNMYLDFIHEFVKFADNTRDIELQNNILDVIQIAEKKILNHIKFYENRNKENLD